MTICGLRTVRELRGIPCIPFEPTPKIKQQLCVSRSFGTASDDIYELRAAVAFFTTRVAEKLREHKLVAGKLSVCISTDRFKDCPQYGNSAVFSVAPKSDDTPSLLALSLEGLARIYRPGFLIRKAGVMLDDLELAEHTTRPLWGRDRYELSRRLMFVIDSLNEKFGADTVQCGLFPSKGVWKTRFDYRSQAYTTNWREIMTAQ